MAYFANWCNVNQGFLSAILASASLIISSVAIVISLVTSRKQRKDQISIAKRQEDLQKRQIKVDAYPYRIECWKVLIYLKMITEGLKNMSKAINFHEKSPAQLIDVYHILIKNIPYSSSEIIIALMQAQTSVPQNTWLSLERIKKLYDEVVASFIFLEIHDKKILTEEEMKEVKIERVNIILSNGRELDKVLFHTIQLINTDLCIGDLHKQE